MSSVPATTIIAPNTSTSRSSSSIGISSAVASVTTPRRPAQPTTIEYDQGGRSRSLPRDSSGARPMSTQTIRMIITPSSTARQKAAIRLAGRSVVPMLWMI